MKSYQIFLSLIILFQLISLTYEQENEDSNLTIDNLDNLFSVEEITEGNNISLKFIKQEGVYYVTILTRRGKIKMFHENDEVFKFGQMDNCNVINVTSDKINENQPEILNITAEENSTVEITSVRLKDTTKGLYVYQLIEYNIDTEIKVKNNSFVIFLNDDIEKFDMKFKFNSINEIKDKKIYYGFLCLPTKKPEYSVYLAQGKNYIEKTSNLTWKTYSNVEFEEKVINKYYKNKVSTEEKKPNLAFIFSVDSSTELNEFTFSINSEIINIFLMVSIIIALVFAVITFFLIRRKQSAESISIEETRNSLLKNDQEEGEGKGKGDNEEKGKGDNEEKGKEGGEEKEEKVINDENTEQEQKKIEAAEN